MTSYDPNSEIELPWFETNEIFKLGQVPAKFKDAAKSLHHKGYCVLDTEVDECLIDAVNEGIYEHLKKDNPKLNPDFYHYNSSPRIIEGWKHIPSIVSLSNNKTVLDFLEIMYERTPLPFSTINFLRGSEQPLHSDYMHFSSKPERYLCGAWFALEDVHQDSGPLAVVAESRDLPIVTIDELGLEVPKNTKQLKMVEDGLKKENIYPRRYFYPSLDTLKYIKPKQYCKISRDISSRILCLPMYPELETINVKKICKIIKNNLC